MKRRILGSDINRMCLQKNTDLSLRESNSRKFFSWEKSSFICNIFLRLKQKTFVKREKNMIYEIEKMVLNVRLVAEFLECYALFPFEVSEIF